MKFGVLTGGGDCPGLNAAIRGVVYRAAQGNHLTLGFLDGWKGVRDALSRPLTLADVVDVVGWGGTILGSSRTNPFARPEDAEKVRQTLRASGIDALIAIGGDDTLSAAKLLHDQGGKVVGVPKTMDNDVAGTDWTFGFDSAASVAMDALGRLKDTAKSHHRIVVLEVMGRHAGWVALATGLGGGADVTLVPEEPYQEETVVAKVRAALGTRGHALVVVAESVELGDAPTGRVGRADEFGHELMRERGVGARLAERLESLTRTEARSAQIGHIQRGGPPTLFDRILALRLGAKAVDLALERKFGTVAVLRGEEVRGIPLAEAIGQPKRVTRPWTELLHTFER